MPLRFVQLLVGTGAPRIAGAPSVAARPAGCQGGVPRPRASTMDGVRVN